ncbi:MAG TPA: cytochrome c peroxidase [Chitinophagales bacterium]|nr:cytochrome c peroxidase [Chitinophagales bacterium]
MKTINSIIPILFVFLASIVACNCDDDPTSNPCGEDLQIEWQSIDTTKQAYPFPQYPTLPQTIPNNPDNPATIAGVELGRRLFYDPILSGDSTQSCASCHAQGFGFTDNLKAFSTGIDGINGRRNAMALINLTWVPRLFWDGRATGLEDQALRPVTDPIEMHNTWENAVCDLMSSPDYRQRFYKAFGIKTITKEDVVNAIAQFERTLISGTARYDLATIPGSGVFLTEQEYYGYSIFFNEVADCFHCHTGSGSLFTDNQFHNNGLDSVATLNDYPDKGLGEVTKELQDNGYFRTPTLRNIELTAPYMHDGRFQTLEEVVDHYSDHVKQAENVDPTIKVFFKDGGKHLSPDDKAAVVAFLKTLTDTAFVNNPAFKSPF